MGVPPATTPLRSNAARFQGTSIESPMKSKIKTACNGGTITTLLSLQDAPKGKTEKEKIHSPSKFSETLVVR